MYSLRKKLMIVASAFAGILGLSAGDANATIQSSYTAANQTVTEQSLLFLNLGQDASKELAHGSHVSHASHESHVSHYSSR